MTTATATWRKSTASHANGNCAEVAVLPAGTVAVRDTKHPDGPVLTFTAEAWREFTASRRCRHHDLVTTTALTTILGAAMVISGLAVKFVGLPRQIAVNWRRKTAPHASRLYAVLGTLSYATAAGYTWLEGDWLTGLVNLSGAAVTGILLWQVMRYRDAG